MRKLYLLLSILLLAACDSATDSADSQFATMEFDGIYLLLDSGNPVRIQSASTDAAETWKNVVTTKGINKKHFVISVTPNELTHNGVYVKLSGEYELMLGRGGNYQGKGSFDTHYCYYFDTSLYGSTFDFCPGGVGGFNNEITTFRSKLVADDIRVFFPNNEVSSGAYFFWIKRSGATGGISSGFPFLIKE